jgi:hypothetical protein
VGQVHQVRAGVDRRHALVLALAVGALQPVDAAGHIEVGVGSVGQRGHAPDDVAHERLGLRLELAEDLVEVRCREVVRRLLGAFLERTGMLDSGAKVDKVTEGCELLVDRGDGVVLHRGVRVALVVDKAGLVVDQPAALVDEALAVPRLQAQL